MCSHMRICDILFKVQTPTKKTLVVFDHFNMVSRGTQVQKSTVFAMCDAALLTVSAAVDPHFSFSAFLYHISVLFCAELATL